MVKRKSKSPAGGIGSARPRVSAEEKIARVLGMLLVKDIEKKADRVPLLRNIGFEVAEIAEILEMTHNHVQVADHRSRKKRKAG